MLDGQKGMIHVQAGQGFQVLAGNAVLYWGTLHGRSQDDWYSFMGNFPDHFLTKGWSWSPGQKPSKT